MPEPANDLPAVHVGESQIDDHRRGLKLLRGPDALLAAGDTPDVQVVASQCLRVEVGIIA